MFPVSRLRCAAVPTALSTVLTIAFCLPARAADLPPVGSYAIEFTGIQLQLTDLRPDDGLAPDISFDSTGYLDVVRITDSAYQGNGPVYRDRLLPSTDMSWSGQTQWGGRFTASATPDSFKTRVDLSVGDLVSAIDATPWPDGTVHAHAAANHEAGVVDLSSGWPADAFFTVSAHTSVKLQGHLTMSKTLDPTALDAWLAESEYQGYTLTDGTSSHSVQLTFSGPLGHEGFHASQFTRHFLSSTPLTRSQLDGAPVTDTLSMPFEVSFSNTGDDSFTGQFGWYLGVIPALQIELSSTPVPEPATWSLMGVGCLALAWLRRRAVIGTRS